MAMEGSQKASEIRFVKMEGAGNDYVYVDCFEQEVPNPQAFARRVSRRHFGVGSDGVIFIRPSSRADCFMDMYNADGSRGRACGNGLRCVAAYMYDRLGRKRQTIRVETLSGVRQCTVESVMGRRAWVKAEMGPALTAEDVKLPMWEVAHRLPPDVRIAGAKMVDVGNPHCVLFLEKAYWEEGETVESYMNRLDISRAGAFLENYEGFASGVNVEFCMALERPAPWPSVENITMPGFGSEFCGSTLRVRVWERGSGETLACGSGACAVYAALGDSDRPGCIFMNGGRLCVEQRDDGEMLLSGEAVRVFEGCIF